MEENAGVGKSSFFNFYGKGRLRQESPIEANSRENFDEEQYACVIDPQTVCPQNQFIVNSSNHFFLCQARQDNQTREGLSKDSERFLVFFFEI